MYSCKKETGIAPEFAGGNESPSSFSILSEQIGLLDQEGSCLRPILLGLTRPPLASFLGFMSVTLICNLAVFDLVLILPFLCFSAVAFCSGGSKQDAAPAGDRVLGNQIIQTNDLGFPGLFLVNARFDSDWFFFCVHTGQLYQDACQEAKVTGSSWQRQRAG